MRRVFHRDARPGAEQRDIHPGKRVFPQFLDRDLASAKRQLFPRRARRGEQGELADRKIALFERLHHLHSHGSGGSDDCDV